MSSQIKWWSLQFWYTTNKLEFTFYILHINCYFVEACFQIMHNYITSHTRYPQVAAGAVYETRDIKNEERNKRLTPLPMRRPLALSSYCSYCTQTHSLLYMRPYRRNKILQTRAGHCLLEYLQLRKNCA